MGLLTGIIILIIGLVLIYLLGKLVPDPLLGISFATIRTVLLIILIVLCIWTILT